MKTILIQNGILHIAESKAICPNCERHIPFNEIDDKFMKQDENVMLHKCKCKAVMGITVNYKGDFIAFDLDGDE